jgi:hypothetical protein
VQIKNKIFLARVNKKKNVEVDSPASSGRQGKYIKYVSLPLPPLDAPLTIYNISFFFVKNIFKKDLI